MGAVVLADSYPLLDEEEPEDEEMSYGEICEHHCSYYLSLGMSYEDYWYGDACLVRYYREVDQITTNKMNTENWLLGLYIEKAVGVAIAKAFGEDVDYPAEPFPLTKEEADERLEQARIERMQSQIRKLEREASGGNLKS